MLQKFNVTIVSSFSDSRVTDIFLVYVITIPVVTLTLCKAYPTTATKRLMSHIDEYRVSIECDGTICNLYSNL